MPQISTLVSDEDVKNLDKLVEKGIFKSREEVILRGIKLLSNQDIEDIRKMNECELVVDNFLLDNIGDMTYADTPVVEIRSDKKIFRYTIKTEQKKITLGYIYIDPDTMEILENLSDSVEEMKKAISIGSNA